MKDGSGVAVWDKDTGEELAFIPVIDSYGDMIVRVQVIDDVLYVGDSGSGSNIAPMNAIHVGSLSDAGMEIIRSRIDSLNGITDEPTDAPTDAPTEAPTQGDNGNATDAPTEAPTQGDNGDATNAPDQGTSAAGTSADTQAPTDSGCASALVSGGALMVLIAAAFVTAKRK